MFDPTAFDNMKVVIEGALYDRDIKGEIVITDRNDWFNMAKLSRSFDVSFRLPDSIVNAKVGMTSKLINQAAELLPAIHMEEHAGCFISLQFMFEQENEPMYQELKNILLEIWGEGRDISISIQNNPLEKNSKQITVVNVDFGRLITEDQMDDLVEMTDFIITTLERLDL